MTHRRRRRRDPEVVYVERPGDSSAKWLFWGAVLGAGMALMYAPGSGEETRRGLQRRLRKLRAMAEETLDELAQQFGGQEDALTALEGGEDDLDEAGVSGLTVEGSEGPRDELERRLARARSRRRGQGDLEEPSA